MGSIRGEGTPPQTLAVIWRKKGVPSLSSGCSRKIKEGDQPPPPPPPPPPHHKRAAAVPAAETAASPRLVHEFPARRHPAASGRRCCRRRRIAARHLLPFPFSTAPPPPLYRLLFTIFPPPIYRSPLCTAVLSFSPPPFSPIPSSLSHHASSPRISSQISTDPITLGIAPQRHHPHHHFTLPPTILLLSPPLLVRPPFPCLSAKSHITSAHESLPVRPNPEQALPTFPTIFQIRNSRISTHHLLFRSGIFPRLIAQPPGNSPPTLGLPLTYAVSFSLLTQLR